MHRLRNKSAISDGTDLLLSNHAPNRMNILLLLTKYINKYNNICFVLQRNTTQNYTLKQVCMILVKQINYEYKIE